MTPNQLHDALIAAGQEVVRLAGLIPGVLVARVVVTPTVLRLWPGEMIQLAAWAYDRRGNLLTGGTTMWASSDPAVATVDSLGVVTGRAPGSATITATIGDKTASAQATVTDAVLVEITIAPQTISVPVGRTEQLLATGHYSDGTSRPLP